MNAFEFESRLHHEDQLTIPPSIASKLKDGQRLRVVMMVLESDADSVIETAPAPFAKFAGRWDPNDPVIDEWQNCVEDYRRQVEEDPNIL